MTQIDTSTEAVKALLDGVTEGPWVDYEFSGDHWVSFANDDSWYNQRQPNARFIAASRELVPALLAERDALKAEMDRLKAQAVTVKPLEWRHNPQEPQGYTWKAAKPFGSAYYLHEKDGTHSWGGDYVSLEAAKAAAQADYEDRILSAITARTEDEVWNEMFAVANEYMVQQYGIGVLGNHIDQTRIRKLALARPTKGVIE